MLSERRITATPIPITPKGPLGAAMAQWRKPCTPSGNAAGPRQPIRVGDCLGWEVESPTRRVSVGDH